MPRASVVWNPISGTAARRAALEAFQGQLRSRGWDVVATPTEHAGHAVELAAAHARDEVDVIVAAGGDGTLNEVVRGRLAVEDGRSRVGMLPRGTSNLVAREFGVPFDPVAAAEIVAARRARAIDVVRANDALFVACAGVGWDAQVVHELAAARRGHISYATYLLPSLRAILRYDFPELHVTTAEGEQHVANTMLLLNTRPYATFFRPVPGALPDDGLLDVVLLSGSSRRRLPAWIYRSWRGTLALGADAVHLRTRGLEVRSDRPVAVQLDGDGAGFTPLTVEVAASAVELVVP